MSPPPFNRSINLWRLHGGGHRGDNFLIKAATEGNPSETEHLLQERGNLTLPHKNHPLSVSSKMVFAKAVKDTVVASDNRINDKVNSISSLIAANREDQTRPNKYGFEVSFVQYHGIFPVTMEGGTELIVSIFEYFHPSESLPQAYLSEFINPKLPRNEREESHVDIFFEFAFALCDTLRVVHNNGVVHSLLVPRNLLVPRIELNRTPQDRAAIKLVGFGYATSFDTKHPDQDLAHLTAEDKMFQAPECRLKETFSAFSHPSDIFSIGAILYWLLTGRGSRDSNPTSNSSLDILREPPVDVDILKRAISQNIRLNQSALYEKNENITKILDTCLRYNPDERFSCIEELEDALRIASNARGLEVKSLRGKKNQKPLKDIIGELRAVGQTASSSTFRRHFDTQVDRIMYLAQRLTRDKSAHFEVYGTRDLIVNSLCKLLGTASSEQYYCTVTLPNYWNDTNLGSNGRFLTMNKHMARKGLKTRRLFLATASFHEMTEEDQQVLEWQQKARNELENEDPEHARNFEIKVCDEIPGEVIAEFERSGSIVGCLGPVDPESVHISATDLRETICLNFFSTARTEWVYGKPIVNRQIKKVRYWSPSKHDDFRTSFSLFERYWKSAKMIDYFIDPKGPSPLQEIKSSYSSDIELLEELLKQID